MNTNQLMCFVLVAEKLSFTKASEQLYLSVPTVTHHIKTLEYELETSLLIRNKHKVELTFSGKMFYEDAKLILEMMDNAKKHLKKPQSNQNIKIICTSKSELELIAAVLIKLKAKISNFKPEIYVKNYSEGLNLLKEENADLMLGSSNMIVEDKKLKLYSCINLTSYLIVRKDDPLYLKDQIYFKDLEKRTLIQVSEKLIPFYSKNRIKNLVNMHKGWQNDFKCDNEDICFTLIKAGYGISILPEYRIPKILDSTLGLKSITENEPYKYGIIANNTKKPLIKTFIDEYEKVIADYKFNDSI